jgi:dUTP pyrophosphatase
MLFIQPLTDEVAAMYTSHSTYHVGDSGLDVFCTQDQIIPAKSWGNKIHLGFCAEMRIITSLNARCVSYYLYPRSSTGLKTPLRLSNSVGIIDAGYRGELIAIVDNLSDEAFMVKKGERYFQICAPNLEPIEFELVSALSTTSRGVGGLGSTTQ